MGNELFKTVTKATGLPQDLVAQELSEVLSEKGLRQDQVTMPELRQAMAEYLREAILQAKDKFEDGFVIEEEVAPEDLGKET